ncbi:histidine phosphatase family protein [Alterisphingorhabdus coralli]|uniref:Histidine phosphatase family protein n=1 Tax=Alterisphingorhabdus coralli TaxID=3071408 RepID=A0AA97F757_9SPHN|nr:histidine phosphatase family protein [Parasphingorhabdus sp. SCSIO 66989]WOE74498.1 histidine phosphatase family protein [Parasphingorhabdus sp. SCSIO 66989]
MTNAPETSPPAIAGRLFIARHGETVFNAAARLQGENLHTPLTRAGFAQADGMGAALREVLGAKPSITLWASETGRALQTLAVIAEHLELDWHQARRDTRLAEIGMGSWGGRYYADVTKEYGPIVDMQTRLLTPAPDGEHYTAIAERVSEWAAEHGGEPGDKLVIMHGISSRVLRGVLLGVETDPVYGAPIAPGLPQGSVTCIENGEEHVVVTGTGGERA